MTTSGKRLLRDPVTRRMAFCLVTSIFAHLALMWATGLSASRHQHPPLFLQAELRTVMAETPAPPAIEGTASEVDPPALAPGDGALPEITPPTALQADRAPKVLNLSADIYYASSEVDTRAEPLNEVNLVYPLIPFQQRVGGMVRLNIFVNEQGGVDKTVVVDSNPTGIFEEAALQAVAELKFSPAIKNGIPVKNRKTIAVTFDPYEIINTP